MATYRDSDSSPKEQFVYHNAGLDGRGASSYIDTVILRDKDANTAWSAASDGVLEERTYYCHNWRGDVSVLITDTGAMVEWVRYSSYGVPFGLPKGDTDSDGDLDSTDNLQISVWDLISHYDVRGDLDLDGDVDSTDHTNASGKVGTVTTSFQIAITTRDQIWTTLGQTGNWDLVKLDLNGDGVFTGADEYNDDRTHNDVNELTFRDTDDNGTNDFTLTSDKLGNLTDDGEHWKYTYDPFGRLRKIDKRPFSPNPLVVEYTYNGLGHRIGWHYDVDADGTVEDTSDDPWFRFVYDERWRIVATYRASDSSPKEQFVHHNAGAGGFGGSSYIDTVVLRDKDANPDGIGTWSAASDRTLEERIYYCHNWRGDVVALIDDTADQVEQVRYSSYGVPFGLPRAKWSACGRSVPDWVGRALTQSGWSRPARTHRFARG